MSQLVRSSDSLTPHPAFGGGAAAGKLLTSALSLRGRGERRALLRSIAMALIILVCAMFTAAAGEGIPHAQSKPPGPALTPQEAIAKMTVPPDFQVQLVAAEPDIINPTAFTFDTKGRIWVCESVEYPRRQPGVGKDRVKILEDADKDGRFEKVTIFKEGLNIPCGVVLGNGGVYVTNAPDILFLQDTDGDGKCDKEEVVFTGFGRHDTHELPNTLIWGPDGWLYGMNGVFNGSSVTYNGKTHNFTCAIFRYHPKLKRFELFAEGTSNPWGLDYNLQGDWFLSCCVIDHLFHMTQSGYYVRQGGPYPPFTHPLQSVTTERHQAAAYAGLCFYHADVYPEQYRGTLLMGNLHGSAINNDVLTRNGSTYIQKNAPDFLSANDAWFMPVSQKVGPDGCVYIMDWYDRYHCYQDANRDPEGIDRGKGRIYRVTYKNTPPIPAMDMEKLSNDELLKLLGHSNAWWRREAQRLLNEKFDEKLVPALQQMAFDENDKTQAHMHATWLLCSQPVIDEALHLRLLSSNQAVKRNWGVRAAGLLHKVSEPVYNRLKDLAADVDPDVRVQVAIAAGRQMGNDPLQVLFALLKNPENAKDPLIPTIIYNNLTPLADKRMEEILTFIDDNPAVETGFAAHVVPWIREVIAAHRSKQPKLLVSDLKRVLARQNVTPAKIANAISIMIGGFMANGLPLNERAALIDGELRNTLKTLALGQNEARVPALVAAQWWHDPAAVQRAMEICLDNNAHPLDRQRLIQTFAFTKNGTAVESLAKVLLDGDTIRVLRQEAIDALGGYGTPQSTATLLDSLKKLPPEYKSLCVNALTRTKEAAATLVAAVENKQVALSDINSNNVRQIAALDAALGARIGKLFGTIRTERDPERAEIIKRIRGSIGRLRSDVVAGWKVFEAKCQQCHIIYGKGNDVGPDLTGVGRENIDAILTNLLDPNLVIGQSYYTHVVKTKDGKLITGLLAEDSEARVILKREGGVRETIARDNVADIKVQTLSLMPEGLEKNMTEQELAHLVAFLLTTGAPARPPEKDLAAAIQQFAPEWKGSDCGDHMEPGIRNENGKTGVLVTHPLSEHIPFKLTRQAAIPAGKNTTLKLVVGHHKSGDWNLVVQAGGKELMKQRVAKVTAKDGWLDLSIPLNQFAGQTIELNLLNEASGWNFEGAYWAEIKLVSE